MRPLKIKPNRLLYNIYMQREEEEEEATYLAEIPRYRKPNWKTTCLRRYLAHNSHKTRLTANFQPSGGGFQYRKLTSAGKQLNATEQPKQIFLFFVLDNYNALSPHFTITIAMDATK